MKYLPHFLSILNLLLCSSLASAQSLRATAEQELSVPALSSPEVSSLDLQLKDSYQAQASREFHWSLGFFLQNYSAQGQIQNNSVNEDLSKSGRTVLPSLSFGSLYNLSDESSAGIFQIGLEAEVGFISQKVSLLNASGHETEARLDSSLLELRPLMRWGRSLNSPLHGRFGIGIGRLNLTQSSDSSLLRWSKSGGYLSWLFGLEYQLSSRWGMLAQYKILSKRSDGPSDIELPPSQLELGAQILW